MAEHGYKYIIVGAGLAGASAVEGIRELDKDGLILLIGDELHLPYHRPPISKSLWFGKKKSSEIFVKDQDYYSVNGVTVLLGTSVLNIDANTSTVVCSDGKQYSYDKLLIATGGIPRKLEIPGGDLDGIFYYRYLADYNNLRLGLREATDVLVIGAGFIGSEMTAALNHVHANVTLLNRDEYICNRIFPRSLGEAVEQDYRNRGISIINRDSPVSIEKSGNWFLTRTRSGQEIRSEFVVAGLGIVAETELARSAGLQVNGGIVVSELLQSSNPNIYAAGDNTVFPYLAFDTLRRVEHWDNAQVMGKCAGMNMAGQARIYDHMPYFFSDLFDFGYEAVGQTDSRLDMYCDWQEENKKGVIYYLDNGLVVGAMMCNVWDQVDAARELIRSRERYSKEQLRGAIGAQKTAR